MGESVAPKPSASTNAPTLAARAYIRHHHTDYHDRLDNANVELGDDIDDDDYRKIKHDAHDDVEAFLDAHRQHHSGGGTTV